MGGQSALQEGLSIAPLNRDVSKRSPFSRNSVDTIPIFVERSASVSRAFRAGFLAPYRPAQSRLQLHDEVVISQRCRRFPR